MTFFCDFLGRLSHFSLFGWAVDPLPYFSIKHEGKMPFYQDFPGVLIESKGVSPLKTPKMSTRDLAGAILNRDFQRAGGKKWPF